MSRSRLSPNRKPWRWLAGAVLCVGALAWALALPPLARLAKRRSAELIASASKLQSSDPKQATVLYREAAVLDPGNPQIANRLADTYLQLNQPDQAITVLRQSGGVGERVRAADITFATGRLDEAARAVDAIMQDKPSGAASRLRSRILLEQGRGEEATQAARQAVDYDLTDQATQLQLGLCYAAAQTGSLASYISSLQPGEASQALRQADTSSTALARLLYSQRLLRSAEAVLTRQANHNSEDYVLLGQIKLASPRPSASELAAAKNYLSEGIKRDPGNLQLHRLLLQAEDLAHDPAANQERDRVNRLESGQI